MKRLILALIVSTSLLSANFFKEEDKQLHIAATTMASVFGGLLAKKHGYNDTEAFWIGFGTAIAIGLAKEAYDSRDGGTGFDSMDMLANSIGGALGAGTSLILYRF